MNTKVELSNDAKKLLKLRYCKSDEEPEDVYPRVADALGGHDGYEKEFLEIMASRRFLPNSPALMNMGWNNMGKACFVFPIHDSMESIFQTLKDSAMTFKVGGGVGANYSELRQKGSPLSMAGTSSGVLSFINLFDTLTDAVKQGGCLSGGTLIATEQGIRGIDTLEDSKENETKPISLGVFTDDGIATASAFYNNGKDKTKIIKTQYGYGLQGTYNHKIRFINEDGDYIWKELKDASLGDWVCLQLDTYQGASQKLQPIDAATLHFNSNNCLQPAFLSEELCELIGFYIGNGSIGVHNQFMLSVAWDHIDLVSYFDNIMERLFDMHLQTYQKPNDRSIQMRYVNDMFYQWAHLNKLTKQNSLSAHIPQIVMQSESKCVCGFLRGLFEADGHIDDEGYHINLSSTSLQLIDEVRILLLSLGISTHSYTNANRENAWGKNPIHYLSITTYRGLICYREKIGFLSGDKKKRLENIHQRENSHNDIIPHVGNKLREFYRNLEIPNKRKFYRKIWHYFDNVKNKRQLTYNRFDLLKKEYPFLNECFIQDMLNQNQFYDKIVSIEDSEDETYDLIVDKNHTYIANGFVSHNTRRGASMAVLDIDHPDIFDFIKAKITPGMLSNFNLSVMVNNEFMEKVPTDEYQYLRDVQDRRRTVGKYKARDLFNIMTFAAYLTGDPGLMFYDRINQDNPFKEKIKASNPCVSGNTLIWIPDGVKKAKDMRIGNEIVTAEGTIGIVDKIEHHKSVFTYHIEMHDGTCIEATASHQFYAQKNGEWLTRFLRVDQLNDGDRIVSYNTRRGEEIKSILPLFHREVYDIHEPTTDTWITNGYISRGCGEVCMFPYESCCLGSINLNEHIVDNDIDWSKFKETAEIGTQMLLSINKYSEYPVDECYKQNYKMNRIGLGLMGFADALMKMHIKYDSDETLELIDKITGCMFDVAKKKAPTSASVLSIAPTGSLSILASCSPSIEPIFSESYTRNLTFGTVDEVREKNEYLRTAHEVSPMWHLKIQARFQKTIDNAVSKCLRKGTKILTNKGLMPIETFHSGDKSGFEKTTEDIYVFDQNLIKQRILHGYYDGIGEIIRIMTEDGFELEGSANHKILTQMGWKTLSELSLRDYVKRHTNICEPEYKKISSIRSNGFDHLYDIAITGDHVYLVNGFVTHNTVNLPHDTTIQDIYDVYYNAWKMGCKGVTVFRDGSKGDQVMISKPTSKCDGDTCYL